MTAGGACPVPTPEQARFGAALERIRGDMLEKIEAAIAEAHEAAGRLPPARADDPAMPHGFFVAIAHHRLFTTLCGADADTGQGGDPARAAAVLRNFQGLARSWDAARPAPDADGTG